MRKCELCEKEVRNLDTIEGLKICRACQIILKLAPSSYYKPIRFHNLTRANVHMNGCPAAPVPPHPSNYR